MIRDAIEAVREAERFLTSDEALREEERRLLGLMERIEGRLAVLSARPRTASTPPLNYAEGDV